MCGHSVENCRPCTAQTYKYINLTREEAVPVTTQFRIKRRRVNVHQARALHQTSVRLRTSERCSNSSRMSGERADYSVGHNICLKLQKEEATKPINEFFVHAAAHEQNARISILDGSSSLGHKSNYVQNRNQYFGRYDI
ncbi:Hypothetical_protein [Hexamita inflata]|uniref:Hypothetical_protein n=1 Tax=Hexamita inflata TaxID=28002 RepID=A0AA86QWX6_9EUKA|nr:Hypothetical protein HINF_LOCUS48594 [Hexamita inflata]